ncbi:MAG: ABC transporter ATP-binding protein [Planctomycetes bacterium]|nr:ABC transporter ATP-binding protein [Planctomycetota bacterium]
MIETEGLTKRYDNEVLAVDGLSLRVEPGEVFAMLGANGAGKTTTLMMLLGFVEPTAGTARIHGVDVVRQPLEAKAHVAYVSENVQLYGSFTALQNLEFFARLGRRRPTREECEAVLRRVGLPADAFRRRVRGYSKGMRQRLGIGIAILRDTPAILLDEPTSGLDPKGGLDFLALLDGLRAEGKAIWMTTHDIFRTREVADRVGMMVRGRLVTILRREELATADLARLYARYVDDAGPGGGAAPEG